MEPVERASYALTVGAMGAMATALTFSVPGKWICFFSSQDKVAYCFDVTLPLMIQGAACLGGAAFTLAGWVAYKVKAQLNGQTD